jgi:hypothetical protein
VSLKLKATPVGVTAASYAWEFENSSFSAHSGPHHLPGEESWRDNQTVFFRGYKIMAPQAPLLKPRVLWISDKNKSKILKTTPAPFC